MQNPSFIPTVIPNRPRTEVAGITDTRSAEEDGSGPAPVASPAADWQAGNGIVDRMLAYRDWWNLPVRPLRSRGPHGANRSFGKPDRAAKSDTTLG